MRMPFTLIVALSACLACSDRELETSTFKIVVVGDGVVNTGQQVTTAPSAPLRPLPLNRAQGQAMLRGVRAAQDDPSVRAVEDLFELVTHDDLGDREEADRLARHIARDPNTLFVIGHATSGTTRAAAQYYDDAGIPLIMPIATSPLAVQPKGSSWGTRQRFETAIRLPPADDRIQAPALALTARAELRAKRIFFVRDDSVTAREYSEPLFNEVVRLLEAARVGNPLGVNLDGSSEHFTAAATSIKAENPDLVIFCGYGTTAQRLLGHLRAAYSSTGRQARPAVLLTDGAKVEDLDTRGFNIFLTFPTPDVEHFRCDGERGQRVTALLAAQPAPSYEVYGYDAMLLAAEAIAACRQEGAVSRSCALGALSRKSFFDGACFRYQFVRNENTFANYYLYSNQKDERVLAFDRELPADRIGTLAAGSR